jgi:hypothetical protein
MIIISETRGQLGNRLFLNAYAMTLARASGQKLIDFSFNEYRFLFPATRWRAPQKLHFFIRKAVRFLIQGLQRLPWMQSCFLKVGALETANYSPDNPEFIATVKARRLTFIEGFPEPSHCVLSPTDPIRAKFTPDPVVLEMVRKHIAMARTGADVLIGLHVRRGDYSHFFGGRFHYPTSFYLEIMRVMTSFFPDRKVAFLLCINGPPEFDDKGPYRIVPGPGMEHGALGDLHCLAECDYVIGPPSTFSLWAAFYGRKPLLHLIEQKLPTSVADFTVPDGHFECFDLKLSREEMKKLFAGENEFYSKHRRTKTLYENFNVPK